MLACPKSAFDKLFGNEDFDKTCQEKSCCFMHLVTEAKRQQVKRALPMRRSVWVHLEVGDTMRYAYICLPANSSFPHTDLGSFGSPCPCLHMPGVIHHAFIFCLAKEWSYRATLMDQLLPVSPQLGDDWRSLDQQHGQSHTESLNHMSCSIILSSEDRNEMKWIRTAGPKTSLGSQNNTSLQIHPPVD